ncbi:MAG: hypothetical protein WC050_00110 [Candidatus Paceibacterota bacterium]
MPDKFAEEIVSWLRPFYGFKALIGWVVLIMLVLGTLNSVILNAFLPKQYLFYFDVATVSIFIAIWLFGRFRLPRKKRDRLNIVISISTEHDPSAEVLKSDLMRKLRADLVTGGISDSTHVIDLPEHFARTVNGGNIARRNRKTRGDIWIWGFARHRGAFTYLDLEGYVSHRPVSINIGSKLSRDFREALPVRLQFTEDMSFHASEIAGDMIYYTVRYITGVAALISGKPDSTLNLHTRLKEEIAALPKPLAPNVQAIYSKLDNVISDAHAVKGIAAFNAGRLDEAREEVGAALTIAQRNYSALILRSIIEFKYDNDASAALETTDIAERAAPTGDVTWKFNRAFLLLVNEDFDHAQRVCRSLERHTSEGDTRISNDSINFSKKMIADGDRRPQLLFWIGFLYYRKLQNPSEALDYLERFLEQGADNMANLKLLASAWVDEINRQMDLP